MSYRIAGIDIHKKVLSFVPDPEQRVGFPVGERLQYTPRTDPQQIRNQELDNLIWASSSRASNCSCIPYLETCQLVLAARHGAPEPIVLVVVGGDMPGRRGERRSELQPPLAEGQPPHAADSQSSCQRRGKDQRQHLRDRVSSPGAAHGT